MVWYDQNMVLQRNFERVSIQLAFDWGGLEWDGFCGLKWGGVGWKNHYIGFLAGNEKIYTVEMVYHLLEAWVIFSKWLLLR